MKPGDRVRIEIPKSKSLERLEKENVAAIKLILKPGSMIQIEGKELTYLRDSAFINNFAIVQTPNGEDYEVHKDLLKEML